MILANLTRAVREQNYYAVVLEFLIVIAGVVIGFQITAWNEARADRAAEARTLERLKAESEQVVVYWLAEVQRSKRLNEQRRTFLAALSSGVLPDEQREAFDSALVRIMHYPSFNPPSTEFDEIMASGGLERISDVDVRGALSAYASEFEFISGQLIQFRSGNQDVSDAKRGLVINVYEPASPRLRRIEYDFSELSSNEYFVSTMVDAGRDQTMFMYYRIGVLREALDMCMELSRAIGVECDNAQAARDELDNPLWFEQAEDS